MGVVGVLSVLTLVAVQRISRDAKLPIGTNTVIAALSEARTLAIKERRVVMVVFKPRIQAPGEQVIDAIMTEFTGDVFGFAGAFGTVILDRFRPIPDAPVRSLPVGIAVAGPFYHRTVTDRDDDWSATTYLPGINQETGDGEFPGRPVAVMFGTDGSRLTRNSRSDSNRTWVDYNEDYLVQRDLGDVDPSNSSLEFYFEQKFENDEALVSLSPFLAVFDEADARERRGLPWVTEQERLQELEGPGGYISQSAERIHFNRYSGVVMR